MWIVQPPYASHPLYRGENLEEGSTIHVNSNVNSTWPPSLSLFSRDSILSSYPMCMGQVRLGAWPMQRWCATPWSIWDVLDKWAPPWNPPEHSRSFPVQYQKKPNFSGIPKNNFPYINLYPRTIPELLVISRIPSGTPNNLQTFHLLISQNYPCVTER